MEEFVKDEASMRALGARLGRGWRAGDTVLLEGELGAGKTTLVRGVLEGFGWTEPVRSPTFTLLQVYATDPPVLHADLYRVGGWEGTGIEEYLDDHLVLIEWPDRASGLVEFERCWRIHIDFEEDGRRVRVTAPDSVN